MGNLRGLRLLQLALAMLACSLGTDGAPAGKPHPTRVQRLGRPVKLRGARPPLRKEARLAGCGDASTSCASWKKKGYCSGWFYQQKSIGSYWCQATCKTCTAAATCIDQAQYCSTWKSSGFCTPGWFVKNQPINTFWCQKTCGQCGGAPKPGPNPAPKPSPKPSPSPSPDNRNSSDWRLSMLALVNAARAQEGARPLCFNAALVQAATQHSQDQAKMQKMSHTGSDGSDIGQRADRAGYDWSYIGENVAWGYPTVDAVFSGWMNSPGHRVNILNARFKHFGAGKAESNGIYWTQDFGDSSTEGCA